MKIRHKLSGAVAEVDEDYGRHLVAIGSEWGPVEAKKPARKAPVKRAAPEPDPQPAEAPTTEQ